MCMAFVIYPGLGDNSAHVFLNLFIYNWQMCFATLIFGIRSGRVFSASHTSAIVHLTPRPRDCVPCSFLLNGLWDYAGHGGILPRRRRETALPTRRDANGNAWLKAAFVSPSGSR